MIHFSWTYVNENVVFVDMSTRNKSFTSTEENHLLIIDIELNLIYLEFNYLCIRNKWLSSAEVIDLFLVDICQRKRRFRWHMSTRNKSFPSTEENHLLRINIELHLIYLEFNYLCIRNKWFSSAGVIYLFLVDICQRTRRFRWHMTTRNKSITSTEKILNR